MGLLSSVSDMSLPQGFGRQVMPTRIPVMPTGPQMPGKMPGLPQIPTAGPMGNGVNAAGDRDALAMAQARAQLARTDPFALPKNHMGRLGRGSNNPALPTNPAVPTAPGTAPVAPVAAPMGARDFRSGLMSSISKYMPQGWSF